jgi:hypothetical protein
MKQRWELEVERTEVAPVEGTGVRQLRNTSLLRVLTELSNFARFRRPPSTMLSTLISALASGSLRERRELLTEPFSPSLSL